MNMLPQGAPKLEEILIHSDAMTWREKSLKGIFEKMLWRNEETVVVEIYDGPHYPQKPAWYTDEQDAR